MKQCDLIYDWNSCEEGKLDKHEPPVKKVALNDETLRDALQSPSAKNPTTSEKIEILHSIAKLGIRAADIGYPSSSKQAFNDVIALVKEVLNKKIKIDVGCAARTIKADIDPIIEISNKSGLQMEAQTFIGSSPIRCYVENWDINLLLKNTMEAVGYAVKNGLKVMYVTEDSTRSMPETLKQLYTAAIEHGAQRICVCDTVGHATPAGTKKLIHFIRKIVNDVKPDVLIDWHGHNDRGLSVINALTAIEAGADRIHATGLGLGERSGNTPMEILLVNMKLMNMFDQDLTELNNYCQLVHKTCGAPLPNNYPIVGKDAFRTATGVHAATIVKACNQKDLWLRDLAYSSVPASLFGREQVIEVGPMSGKANVIFWLKKRDYKPTEQLVNKILEAAKNSNKILSDDDIKHLINKE